MKEQPQIINEIGGFDGSIYDIPEEDQSKIKDNDDKKKD